MEKQIFGEAGEWFAYSWMGFAYLRQFICKLLEKTSGNC